jgi:hypothetical protein
MQPTLSEGSVMARSLLLVGLAMVSTISAAEPAKAPTGEGIRYEGKFADGSVVALNILETELSVTTKYGRLTVPLAEVKRIELGFRYPEGMEAKILAATENLGSGDFKTREQSQKLLIAYGELAIPAVRQAMKSSVVEAARRAEEVMKKLEDSLTKQQLETRDYDVVVTTSMTIKGTIQTASLKAKTKYFGEATVKLANLRGLRALDSVGEYKVTVKTGE